MNLSLNDYISIFIHQTDLTVTNCVKSKLAPFNLAPEQNLIMMLLWEKDGMTQNEIAEKLLKDKTNIARMVSNLEKKGFIKREPCEKDRRSLHLFLTNKGRELGHRVIPITEDLNKLVCEGITDEELSEVRRILSKIQENVQR
ncbi:MarR family winged helix-turn-helix transcriptional regulator [Metabacillus sediminilitoris]|uniref:MarR family transcriptional regulator n=1 Tax=Metabacillus sediminilitoris TaxID=2567941 RepID=A0A4S4BU96_9BACI|nr:MarR family transcriptional regulator [Metabacillus sediminilitoris]QGQ45112.1 MarR family transcriptional regulator [Metabacillus sediminilitoris]THF76479.1 MarR family transcriptional regulator [Metabacillus sediminilitoris]